MKKITYLVTKKERFMSVLFILVAVSFNVLFNFDMHFNKIYFGVYNYRHALYILCAFAYIWIYFRSDLMFSLKFDKGKIMLRSVLYRIKKEVPIDSVLKLVITKIGIGISGIKDEKNYKFTIPFVMISGVLDKKDYIYILNLFKNVEIEYEKTTQNEILELLTKSPHKQQHTSKRVFDRLKLSIVKSIVDTCTGDS